MATIKMLQYLSLGHDEPWASVPSFIQAAIEKIYKS